MSISKKTKKSNHMIISSIIMFFSILACYYLFRFNHLNYKLIAVHFYYVLLSSLISLLLGIYAYREFRENRSVRVYYIVIAFLGGAIIYFFHGLITPGYLPFKFPDIKSHIDGFIFFGDFSRFWFALMIFIPEFKIGIENERVKSHNIVIIISLLTLTLLFLTFNPNLFPSFKTVNGLDTYFSVLFKVLTLVLLGVEAIKYYMSYQIKNELSVLAIFLGNLLIMESVVIFMISKPWTPIWWFAHNLFLMSFGIMGLGFIYNNYYNKKFIFFDAMSELKNYVLELDLKNEELKQIIDFDSLTGLLNRKAFINHLEDLIKNKNSYENEFALLYLDLDGFKFINDTYGHNIGDEVLKIIGQRLKNSTKKKDLTARIGGDEFIIIIMSGNRNYIEDVAQRMTKTVAKTISIGSNNYNITASIGISLFPIDGLTVEELMKKSDKAMYKIKRSGKNNFMFNYKIVK